MLTVISIGGSIIAPDKPDTEFLSSFRSSIKNYLDSNSDAKLILVSGGGAPARIYQQAYRAVLDDPDPETQDWLGIKATHLNGMLLKAIFADYASDQLVTDPTASIAFDSRILVAAGWKPGFSTDTDAVYLARRFGGKRIINLSNIAKVYTADPKKDPNAVPLDSISWTEFRKMVGDSWTPGANTPFDPIASKIAEEEKMHVICADGRNIENTLAILEGREYTGTMIGA